jgi:hypothetical protein
MKSGFFFSSLFILDIYKLIENELFDLHWCSTLILQGIADQKYPLKKPTAMVVYSYSDSD